MTTSQSAATIQSTVTNGVEVTAKVNKTVCKTVRNYIKFYFNDILDVRKYILR